MLHRLFTALTLLVCLTTTVQAQNQKVLHQTYPVSDTIQQIDFSTINGDVSIEFWTGNVILSEITILLEGCPSEIMEFVVKQGRYDLAPKLQGEKLEILQKDSQQRSIKTKTQECFEQIKVRLFVPKDFEESSTALLLQRAEDN